MDMRIRGLEIHISYLFLAMAALFFVTDLSGFAVHVLLACLLHELGHLAVMGAFSLMPKKLSFDIVGIRMECAPFLPISYRQEALLYAAGPLVNLVCGGILLLTGRGNPYLAGIGVLHLGLGWFNLLPIGVLDGGNILRVILREHLSMDGAIRAERFCAGLGFLLLGAAILWAMAGERSNLSLTVTLGYLAGMVWVQRRQ